jgi:transcription elongation factor GreA
LERTEPSNGTPRLGQAISSYLSTVPLPERETTARELGRFARWVGTDAIVGQISAVDVSRYQEQFPESSVDVNGRLMPVKSFLTSLKTQKLTATNLGAHIRLRRAPTRARTAAEREQEPEETRITEEGFDRLQTELEHLEKTVRPEVTDSLKSAFADKDFRENAPYDAAKQRLAEVQTRINSLRAQISAAAIVEGGNTERAGLGTRVVVRDLEEDEELSYTLVGPGEIDARRGRISIQSPVGRALSDHVQGDTVAVETPAGTMHYRIERIEPPD